MGRTEWHMAMIGQVHFIAQLSVDTVGTTAMLVVSLCSLVHSRHCGVNMEPPHTLLKLGPLLGYKHIWQVVMYKSV